jgi:hypothetical protein
VSYHGKKRDLSVQVQGQRMSNYGLIW